MQVQPQAEHLWLQKLVGTWTYEIEMPAEPGHSPTKLRGTEVVRPIGDLWVALEGKGEMQCSGPSTTVMTLGYDPQKGGFVGTFIASISTYLWVYAGELDPAGDRLVLSADGPDFVVEGKMAKYRDTILFKSDDHRVLTSETQGEDGNWQLFMTAEYRRVGA